MKPTIFFFGYRREEEKLFSLWISFEKLVFYLYPGISFKGVSWNLLVLSFVFFLKHKDTINFKSGIKLWYLFNRVATLNGRGRPRDGPSISYKYVHDKRRPLLWPLLWKCRARHLLRWRTLQQALQFAAKS